MRAPTKLSTFVLAWLLLAAPASAEEESQAASDAAGASPSAPVDAEKSGATVAIDPGGVSRKPSIGLDSLLRPRGPARAPVKPAQPGGRDREQWQQAFSEVRAEIRLLENSLEEARTAVRDRSQGAYQYSPIGGTADTPSDPEILKLRAQLKRDKKALDAAQSRLRELQVEASLSGVPDEWIREPGD